MGQQCKNTKKNYIENFQFLKKIKRSFSHEISRYLKKTAIRISILAISYHFPIRHPIYHIRYDPKTAPVPTPVDSQPDWKSSCNNSHNTHTIHVYLRFQTRLNLLQQSETRSFGQGSAWTLRRRFVAAKRERRPMFFPHFPLLFSTRWKFIQMQLGVPDKSCGGGFSRFSGQVGGKTVGKRTLVLVCSGVFMFLFFRSLEVRFGFYWVRSILQLVQCDDW